MSLRFRRFDNKTYAAVFFLLFGLIFVRYCYYGFEYYLQLDDYIQYHNYTAYSSDLTALIKNLGLLSARPLAGLADIYMWSSFYGCMIVAVGIISAMYAASAVLLHKVFAERLGTGWLFFVVYALLPIAFEGSYWVSASSRIIVGLFFASAALLCFDSWCRQGGKLCLVSFAVLQLLAFCLYEQIVLFSGAATLIIMLFCIKPHEKRGLWGFWMFANAAIYLVITKLAPAGINAARSAMYFPWQEGYWQNLFFPLNYQLEQAFVGGNAATCGKGLLRGFELLFREPNVIYVIIILALCALLFFLSRGVRRSSVSVVAELVSGLFLAVAPVLVFYILKDAWFGARNVVPSLCGLALIADAVFDLIFGRLKKGATIQAAIVSVLALLCCVASVSELHDYRETYLADSAVTSAASNALADSEFSGEGAILLLNVDASYVTDANFYYHEHGYGVTSSDWALTGAVRAVSGRGDLPMLSPVSKYRPYITDEAALSKARAFFYSGGEFFPVTLKNGGDNIWNVEHGGQSLGILRGTDGGYFLEIS